MKLKQEWSPADHKKVDRAILRHLRNNVYQFQSGHDKRTRAPFYPANFQHIDNLLGLAYTSSGECAGLWVCNAGYLMADDTHHFIGFCMTEDGQPVGLAWDDEENETVIKL